MAHDIPAIAGPTLADAFTEIAALGERIAHLERRLEPPPPQLPPERAALLVGLARRMRPGETFLARDVLKAATGEPSLAALVDAVAAPDDDGRQAHTLGQAFRAMVDIPAGGLVLRGAEAPPEHGRRVWTIGLAPGRVEWPVPVHPRRFSAEAPACDAARR